MHPVVLQYNLWRLHSHHQANSMITHMYIYIYICDHAVCLMMAV
jgi:hypothetical protein